MEKDHVALQNRICYPPDPNPKRPKVAPSAGGCDTHVHLFGPPHLYPFQARRGYKPPAAPLQHYLAFIDITDYFGRCGFSHGAKNPPFQALLELMRQENFWCKLCNIDCISAADAPWDDVLPFSDALIAVVPDRLLWGTDWPHGNIFTPGSIPRDGDLVDLLARIAPDEMLHHKIFVDNRARLFGWDQAINGGAKHDHRLAHPSAYPRPGGRAVLAGPLSHDHRQCIGGAGGRRYRHDRGQQPASRTARPEMTAGVAAKPDAVRKKCKGC